MMDNSQKIMPNNFLITYDEYLQKNMKRSPVNSEIFCVNQIDRVLEKSRKQQL